MPRKGIDIGHQLRGDLLPGGGANAAAFLNPGTGDVALERARHQLVTVYQVKADPEKTEALPNCRGDVGQVSYSVVSS